MQRRQFMQRTGGLALAVAAGSLAHVLPSPARAQAASGGLHDSFDALLKRYVSPNPDGVNRVDYARWKASAADLKSLKDYIARLAATPASKLPRAEAFAFWANLYNAITLDVVLGRFPVKSIRDIKSDGLFDPKAYIGPWRSKRVTVEGKQLSLDDIEHETMRPMFKDPRVHYSVNCASYGCPNLLPKAWTAATLEADLDAAARDFVNHKRGVEVIAGNKLRVSSIYKWFRDDFGPDDAAVLAHLKKYAAPALREMLEKVTTIAEDHYDWSLNVVAAQVR